MKRKQSATVSLALVAAVTLSFSSVSHAAPPTAPKPVVALGDSLPAGTGSPDVPPGVLPNGTIVGSLIDDPALIEPGTAGLCERLSTSYPAVVGQHPELDVTNNACPGLKVEEFDTGRMGEGPQYRSLNRDTAAVLLGEGANTIGFPDLAACMFGQDCGDNHPVVQYAKGMLEVLPDMLLKDLKTIRQHAPNAWIVVVAYPEVFGTPGRLGDGCLGRISDNPDRSNRGERQIADELQQGLNASWVTAIQRFQQQRDNKITFVDLSGDSFAHPPGYEQISMKFDACSTQLGDMVNGFDSDVTKAKPFHLNRPGSWVVAHRVLARFAQLGLITG